MHGVDDPLVELTGREREVLAIGRSDLGISKTLFVTRKTVEFHTRNIFRKLALPASDRDNRRVHAVLTFLQQEGG